MGDEYEVTDEEKIQIATQFLLSSPPGEFSEVVTDVRALVGNDDLLNTHFVKTAQEYNTDQMIDVATDSGKVLITKHGEVDDETYIDPDNNQVVTIDHIKQEVTGSAPGNNDPTAEPFRAAVAASVAKYVKNHYPEGVSTVYSSADGGVTLTICISSKKFNPGNFWNGRWRSTWTVTFSPGAAEAEMKGEYYLSVHYYEDGNVQMTTKTEKTVTTKLGGEGEIGDNVAKAIDKAESEFHAGVAEAYKVMSYRTSKGLRRKLPYTRRLVDWDKVAGYSLGKDMTK